MTLTTTSSYSTLPEADRVARILELLSPLPPPEAMAAAEDTPNPYVNLSEFRELCFYGIPEWPGIRETAWKLLLGLLPSDKRKWPSSLAGSRERYLGFVRDFLIKDPSETKADPVDEARLLQIRRDVKRTLPELGVLHRAVPDSPYSPLTSAARRESVLMQPSTPTLIHQSWAIPEEEEGEEEGIGGKEEERKSKAKGKDASIIKYPSPKPMPTSTSTSQLSIPVPVPKIQLPPGQGFTIHDDDDDDDDDDDNFLDMTGIDVRRMKGRASTLKDLPGRGLALPSQPLPNSHDPASALAEAVDQGKEDLVAMGGIKGRNRSRSFSDAAGRSRRIKKAPPRLPLHMPVTRPIEQPQESVKYAVYERLKHLAHPPPLCSPLRPPSPHRPDLHWEVVERILYLYARLNPGVGYVQGMNYLLAPIYWLFAQDPNEAQAANAEADAFFCFTALMTDARDHFIPSLDGDAEGGVKASLSRLSQRLWRRDPGLRADLREKSLQPHYYAFRWCTCLCTMDWPFAEVLRIWDSLLADPERGEGGGKGFPYLADFCCAMLIVCRETLMQGTFEENLIMLQVRRKCAEDEAAERGERVGGGGGRGKSTGVAVGGSGGLPGRSHLWDSATSVVGRHTPVAAEAVRRTTSVFASLTSVITDPLKPLSSPTDGNEEGKWSGWGGPIRPRGDSQATILSRAESESGLDARLRPSAAWGFLGGGRWRDRADSVASVVSTPAAYGTWHASQEEDSSSLVENEVEIEEDMVEVERPESTEPSSPSVPLEDTTRVEIEKEPEETVVNSISRWWGGWGGGGEDEPAKTQEHVRKPREILVDQTEGDGVGRRASMILSPISSYFTARPVRPQSILGIPSLLNASAKEEEGGVSEGTW
ncbi:rab-GTPase-TBC domain-containing protein [Piptocephalis cylindrospora]|uniref:Rab-GTPase-TBC domain-containing protein n=1 Tax=Piptocephalis cylindrospora TaxID=1907219 RepID=A0A4P9Y1G3_9FUNG|nr:rab-GTPase-TBC domain-containing protein [Piptocephalis cylindrospora]|eukprot:RKP12603.1 rab-GTPase-TBC domain-containing protein [Piptocephalis cylindrospora]